jgi:hypothetical protein
MTALIKSSIFLQEATSLEITDKSSLQYADMLVERGRVAEEIIQQQQLPNILKWKLGLAGAQDELKDLLNPFIEGLKLLKSKIIAFQDQELSNKLLTFKNNNVSPELMLSVPMIESRTVTRRKKTDWTIVDFSEVKEDYKIPAINEKKVNALIAQLEANDLDPSMAESLIGGIKIIKTSIPAFKPRLKEKETT